MEKGAIFSGYGTVQTFSSQGFQQHGPKITVVVFGEMGSGKSTVVNAFMGKTVADTSEYE